MKEYQEFDQSAQQAAWQAFEKMSQLLTTEPEQPCPCCRLYRSITEKIERLHASGEHAQGIHRATGVSRYYVVKHLSHWRKEQDRKACEEGLSPKVQQKKLSQRIAAEELIG